MARPRVFFDITANDKPLGRVIIKLRDDVVPRTAENFRQLCTGEQGFSYKGSHFYRVKARYFEGGDMVNNDGSGGKSIYGKTFDDENFTLKHITGSVSMVSIGRNTNNSTFFILGDDAPGLDGKHVVFGQVESAGMDVVTKMATGYGSDSGKPRAKIVIADCGQL